ncbi:MAG: metal-dependent transcriptional regulator [Planctomycetaceae bacterium]
MTSLTVENYLKAILQIGIRSQAEWVLTGQLATALHVSPGTVTSMLKSLAEAGLVEYRPYEGAKLSEAGRKLALRMLRRHRLLELFLVKTLELTWDQVHDESENLEHAVSDELIERIDEFLGRPETDPHGDPIPSADGQMRVEQSDVEPLSELPAGSGFRIARVTNQSREFLRFLADSGLTPQAEGTIKSRNSEAGLMVVSTAQGDVSLGLPAAEQVLVEKRSANSA